MASLTVVRPGMLTSVQDLGRWGHQHNGVPVAGPMDVYSHRLANHLVGNAPNAAALEVTLVGPELVSDGDVLCAVAGAEFALTIDGRAAPMHAPLVVPHGSRLRFGARARGARATFAVRGGIAVPATFGSRATSIISRIGPFGGRALIAGDVLPIGEAADRARLVLPAPVLPLPVGGARLRVIPGPHDRMFAPAALDTLFSARYVVTPQSNRTGYRLEGSALTHAVAADILSEAMPLGSIQVPSSGQPILLMADRGTTGGYPKIATVITADMPLAGQLAPGDWVEFGACTCEMALDALRHREAPLALHRR
jgi:antagonist of KipI